MLLTALPPAPPTPKTVIFGFSSLMSGIFRLIVMALVVLTHSAVCVPRPSLIPTGPRRRGRPTPSSGV